MSNTCDKRIIFHPGVDVHAAVSAAMSYYKEYIESGTGKPGLYHFRTYIAEAQTLDKNGEHRVDVYHTGSSIIVRPSAPAPEPQIELQVPEKEPT